MGIVGWLDSEPWAYLWFWPHLCMYFSPSRVCSPPRWRVKPGAVDYASQEGHGTPQLGYVCSASGSTQWRTVATNWGMLSPVEVSSRAHRGRSWHVVVVVSFSHFVTPLNNGSLFPRQTTLHSRAFLATEPLIPVPSVVSMQPTAVSSPRFDLLTPHFSTQSPRVAEFPRADF